MFPFREKQDINQKFITGEINDQWIYFFNWSVATENLIHILIKGKRSPAKIEVSISTAVSFIRLIYHLQIWVSRICKKNSCCTNKWETVFLVFY